MLLPALFSVGQAIADNQTLCPLFGLNETMFINTPPVQSPPVSSNAEQLLKSLIGGVKENNNAEVLLQLLAASQQGGFAPVVSSSSSPTLDFTAAFTNGLPVRGFVEEEANFFAFSYSLLMAALQHSSRLRCSCHNYTPLLTSALYCPLTVTGDALSHVNRLLCNQINYALITVAVLSGLVPGVNFVSFRRSDYYAASNWSKTAPFRFARELTCYAILGPRGTGANSVYKKRKGQVSKINGGLLTANAEVYFLA
jgi:hypothetical protein